MPRKLVLLRRRVSRTTSLTTLLGTPKGAKTVTLGRWCWLLAIRPAALMLLRVSGTTTCTASEDGKFTSRTVSNSTVAAGSALAAALGTAFGTCGVIELRRGAVVVAATAAATTVAAAGAAGDAAMGTCATPSNCAGADMAVTAFARHARNRRDLSASRERIAFVHNGCTCCAAVPRLPWPGRLC